MYIYKHNTKISKDVLLFSMLLRCRLKNNQQFYPDGSIWRGINKTHRTINKNYIGPEKYTILLSGKVATPIDYSLIWSSTSNNCDGCLEDNISIWRPICPEDYVSLGDVVIKGTDKPTLDFIRVVKKNTQKKLNTKKVYGMKKGFAKVIYNKQNQPISTQTLKKVSIWPIGYNFLKEERINQKNRDLEYSGGYSLFRDMILIINPRKGIFNKT